VNQNVEKRREAERERDAAVSESESLRSERDAATSQLSESERTIREYGESSNCRLLELQDRVVELEAEVAAAADKLREVERDRDLAVKEAAGKEADRGKDKVIKGLNARVEALQRHVEMVSSDLGSESARAQDLSERLTKVDEQLCQERDAHRLALEQEAEKLRLGLENAARDVRVIEKRMQEREEEVANLNVEISQMREREIICLREAARERSELKDRAIKAEVDAQEREKGLEVERQRGVVLAEELKAKIRNLEAQVKRASETAEQASRLCNVERAKVESLSEELVVVDQQKAIGLQSIQALEAKLEKKDMEVGVLKACKVEAEESAKKRESFINKLLEEINGAGTKSTENQALVSDLRAAVAERDAEIERRAGAEAQKVRDPYF
jgi:chromosome segregation ATPase